MVTRTRLNVKSCEDTCPVASYLGHIRISNQYSVFYERNDTRGVLTKPIQTF
jgi:hypothetical protein